MLIYQYTLELKSHKFIEIDDLITDLLAAYVSNGPIATNLTPILAKKNKIEFQVLTSDKYSLNPKWDSDWVKTIKKKIFFYLLQKFPVPKLLGKDLEGDDYCNCRKHTKFILKSGVDRQYESPLICLKCENRYPLYRIINVRREKDEYCDILSWHNDYVNYDQLWLNSSMGEKIGYKEISNFKSDTNQTGFEFAKALKKHFNVPVEYYLYKYYGSSLKSELNRKCPNCNEIFHKGIFEDNYDNLICKNCNIVSNIAFDIR